LLIEVRLVIDQLLSPEDLIVWSWIVPFFFRERLVKVLSILRVTRLIVAALALHVSLDRFHEIPIVFT